MKSSNLAKTIRLLLFMFAAWTIAGCTLQLVPPTATSTGLPGITLEAESPVVPPATASQTPSPGRTPRPSRTPGPTAAGKRSREAITVAPVILESLKPINDLGDQTYLGFEGGLYPQGSNEMPADHYSAGLAAAAAIQPLDVDGNPDPEGNVVLMAIGMSNTSQEVCGTRQVRTSCNPWTFAGQAAQDPAVSERLVIIDGARGGQGASRWDSPDASNYERVNSDILDNLGLSPAQVQVAWVKVATLGPRFSLPSEKADAYELVRSMADIARALKFNYPNLKQVFFSSRIYAGFATHGLNPEPYAYESGFAVKWLIESQIAQMQLKENIYQEMTGDLDHTTVAPWLAWGPYLWAGADTARSDGLIWQFEDFRESDGTHPSQSGQNKVADMLMDFFGNSPHTRCWFLAGLTCTNLAPG